MNDIKLLIETNFIEFLSNIKYSDNIIKLRINDARCDFTIYDNGYVVMSGINNRSVDISNICELKNINKYIKRFFDFNK